MERPFYGRTGLLDNGQDGLPIRKPRLLKPTAASSSSGSSGSSAPLPSSLQWFPTLLTVPQRLLEDIANAEPLSAGLAGFLRVACIAQVLNSLVDPARQRTLLTAVLAWNAERIRNSDTLTSSEGTAFPTPEIPLEFYLPRFRLFTFKEGKVVATLSAVSSRAVTLIGRDARLNDVCVDHPSCSSQHAALQVQFVMTAEADLIDSDERIRAAVQSFATSCRSTGVVDKAALAAACEALWTAQQKAEAEEAEAGGGFTSLWQVELQIVDLCSTNSTKVNGSPLSPYCPLSLMDGDVITFGASTRSYVVARDTS